MGTLKDAEKYYKQQNKTNPTIKEYLRGEVKEGDETILYGAQAINLQVPKHLSRYTEDWDIYANGDPKEEAEELEQLLDKKYGGDYFYVEPAKHEGTFKVKSKITKKGVADITTNPGDVPTKIVAKIRVATLEHHVENIKRALADPEYKFRHEKDEEAWQRIKLAKKKHRSTKKRRTYKQYRPGIKAVKQWRIK